MHRRDFLRHGMTASGLALGLVPVFTRAQESQLNALLIPPLERGTLQAGKRQFQLTVAAGSRRFLNGLDTPTLGINGDYLGPTILLRRDDDVVMNVNNRLAEPTTMHWHGLHVPAIADGGPHQVIEAGTEWQAAFRVQQNAGTFWYHSHMLGSTGSQVYQGLAGMLLVEDDSARQLDLPSEYGVDDIPLVVQDRRFAADGSFSYLRAMPDVMTGVHGDRVLVNGTLNPVFAPATSLVRFRLLNGANARSFVFAFDDGRAFSIVSSGGSLLSGPVRANRVHLAPAERAEIVVDFSDGVPANLISEPLSANSPFSPRGMMARMHPIGRDRLQILAVRPQAGRQASSPLRAELRAVERIPRTDATAQRQFVLNMGMGMGRMRGGGRGGAGGGMGRMGNMFTINGNGMDMGVINHRIAVGSTEIWEVRNDSMMMHPFHAHHGLFQLLDRNGRAPTGMELGELDTVKVGPGETVRFIMRFTNFADSVHPYMYHCHILEHEDAGMMGQFTVE